MNIFVLDESPQLAARQQCDKHVVKMVVEAGQLLSDVHHFYDPDTTLAIYKSFGKGHRNHPCSLWARSTGANYQWLWAHGIALASEFHRRYGKVHATHAVLAGPLRVLPASLELNSARTPFAQAMPERYRHEDAVLAYRTYYVAEKLHFAKWRRGGVVPYWIEEVRNRAETLKELKDGTDGASGNQRDETVRPA